MRGDVLGDDDAVLGHRVDVGVEAREGAHAGATGEVPVEQDLGHSGRPAGRPRLGAVGEVSLDAQVGRQTLREGLPRTQCETARWWTPGTRSVQVPRWSRRSREWRWPRASLNQAASSASASVSGTRRRHRLLPPSQLSCWRRRSRSTNFWILPDEVRGKSSTECSSSGHFWRATPPDSRWSRSSDRSGAMRSIDHPEKGGRVFTHAIIRCRDHCHLGHTGQRHEDLLDLGGADVLASPNITSEILSVMERYPSLSKMPMSPVWYQPSGRTPSP